MTLATEIEACTQLVLLSMCYCHGTQCYRVRLEICTTLRIQVSVLASKQHGSRVVQPNFSEPSLVSS